MTTPPSAETYDVTITLTREEIERADAAGDDACWGDVA